MHPLIASRWGVWLGHLERPRVALTVALALAALLAGLAWPTGFFLDDYMQLAISEGVRAPGTSWDLFTFAPGDADQLVPFVRDGPLPWWTHPELKLRFFRPLSSALWRLDHALFGRAPLGYHVHSWLWYLAVVLAAWVVLRRSLPPSIAGIAIILFAVDDAHWMPAGWLANRNALVAAVPTFLAIAAHVRWRSERWRAGIAWSMLGTAVGFLGAEAALGSLAYIAAYELVAGPGRWRARLLALLPVSAVAAFYFALYRTLGYGSWGSSIYIDPVASPGAFLAAAPARWLALLGTLYGNLPGDLWLPIPALRPLLIVGGLAFTGGALWLLRWALRDASPELRQTLAWLTLGSALSLVPGLATFPTARLLFTASLGAMALLATVLHAFVRRGLRAPTVALLTLHGVFAAASWPVNFAFMSHVDTLARRAAERAPIPDDPQVRVALFNAPDASVFAAYVPLMRYAAGKPLPRAFWTLASAPLDLHLTRTGERELELHTIGGRWLDTVFEQLVRTPDLPLPRGSHVALLGAEVEVLDDDGGHPTRVALRFDVPLEDPSLCFLHWVDGAFVTVTLPAIGESMVLRATPGPLELVARGAARVGPGPGQ